MQLEVYKQFARIYINNSLYLGRKYARLFARGHFLFWEANSFPRHGKLRAQGQTLEHTSASNGGCVYYPWNIFRNMPGFGNWGISFAYSPVLHQSRAKMTADIICSFLGTDNVQGQIWLEFIINWYLGSPTEYDLREREFVLQSEFDVPGSMYAILKSASHTRTFFWTKYLSFNEVQVMSSIRTDPR